MHITKLECDSEGKQKAHFSDHFSLKLGGTLSEFDLVFETYGKLNSSKDNTILIHHSLATHSHVASHSKNSSKGWWEALVGPGKAIDTDRFYVICVNNLGSCYGSTGPVSINPQSGKSYRADFPAVTIEDMVRSQRLLLDRLGIQNCYAIIGGSMGGMLTLCWAHLYPKDAKFLIAISMAHKPYPLQLAHRNTQREALMLDPAWQGGYYLQNPVQGLKLARMISHLFYRGLEEVDSRFNGNDLIDLDNTKSDVVNYYHYNADKFANQYDAYTYLLFLNAMDRFNLEEYGESLFKGITAKIRIIGTDSDVLYPARQQQAVYELMRQKNLNVEYILHHSSLGHDAFLVDAEAMGKYISSICT